MNGPEDFEAVPHFPYSSGEKATTPEACCQRELQSREGMFVDREACLRGIERFQNRQVREDERWEKEFQGGRGWLRRSWVAGEAGGLCRSGCRSHPNRQK